MTTQTPLTASKIWSAEDLAWFIFKTCRPRDEYAEVEFEYDGATAKSYAEIFQAQIRDQALEEAALVCDKLGTEFCNNGEWDKDLGTLICRNEIRSLKVVP